MKRRQKVARWFKLTLLEVMILLSGWFAKAAQWLFAKSFKWAFEWDVLDGEDTEVAENPVAEPPAPPEPKALPPPAPPQTLTNLMPPVPPQAAVNIEQHAFNDESGKPVPMNFDPLPDYVVFEAMFNRKFGKNGTCKMNVMGKPSTFTCQDLFKLMQRIEALGEQANPLLRALYGTVMSVIIKRHGENFNNKAMN
jgi:hypothetical protein